MKRKSFLTKVLALTMAAAIALSGCSDKAAVEESSTNVESSVESSVESKTEESKTEESKTEESKTEESKTEESKTEESKTEESKTQAADGDWAAHYKEYFQNYSMEGKQMGFHFEGEESGMYLVFDMKVGSKDKESIFTFSMNGQDGKNYSMEMYTLEDNSAYLLIDLGTDVKTVYKTKSLQEGATDEMNLAGDYIDTDHLDQLDYVGEETVNGVLYDVLVMKESIDDTEAEMLYYVNRGSQELELIKVNGVEGLKVEGTISPMDKIDIPTDVSNAEELDSENFTQTMVTSLFSIIIASVGLGSN